MSRFQLRIMTREVPYHPGKESSVTGTFPRLIKETK